MTVLDESLLLGAPTAATGYQISRSLRFNSADSAYLSRTPASAGNRKTWTWAGWVKRSFLPGAGVALFSTDTVSPYTILGFNGLDALRFEGLTASVNIVTSAVYRDLSAWMHVVCRVDTTAATASDRVRIYVNGTEQALATTTYPAQNDDLHLNGAVAHAIGRYNAARYFPGYLADVHFIDGQALTPSSFGEFDSNNVWQPKAYTGTYGTNGFKLDFSDNSAATATTLGKDAAGSNNWTPNNLSVTAGSGNDSLVDSPTNYGTDTGAGGQVRGNYCTWNTLEPSALLRPSNGGLELVGAGGGSSFGNARGTLSLNGTKFYWETIVASATIYQYHGIAPSSTPLQQGPSEALGTVDIPSSVGLYCDDGSVRLNGSTISAATGALAANTVVGHAFDGTTGKYWISINGTWRTGDPAAGTSPLTTTSLSPQWFPAISEASSQTLFANFGQRPFAYTAPSGYKALCTQNLPTPTILNGATAMDVKLYTGNGGSQSITGLGFSPDLVWVKTRSASAFYHALYDTVRGAGTTNSLYSNGTEAEGTYSSYTNLTSFDSSGFSLGPTSLNNILNQNNETFVGWCWDAGNTTVTNTQGSITSTVRANPSAGFSIVTATTPSSGASTVGHGLGVAPSLIITKFRNTANNWLTYHASIGNAAYLTLDSTAAAVTGSAFWNNTSPTSTVFSLGSIWASSNNLVAYCFAPVAGYSAFGSYTGNGSADGPFVYTGFRPRWVLVKSAVGAAENWILWDSARSTYNATDAYLSPNLSNAEATGVPMDSLSNGFKLRFNSGTNQSTVTYVYAAFAENPFTISRAR